MIKELSKVILLVAKIREESYNHPAADMAGYLAHKEYDKKIEEGMEPRCAVYALCVDYAKFYKLTKLESAQKACKDLDVDQKCAELVGLMLFYMWNDVIDWAERVLGIDTHKSE